jgi:hypothetical protein
MARLATLRLRGCLLLTALFALVLPAYAHVGNKDVYQELTAGPYKLYVTIRTPNVIPGVATIEVRSVGAPLDGLTVTPLLLTGEASKHPPTPDAMQRSAADANFFTGSLWLMGQGAWQVRFGMTGAAGKTEGSVPVPAMPTALLKMQRPLGLALGALGVVLVLGIVGIVYAAVGESRLRPGVAVDPAHRRRAVLAGAVALVFAVGAVLLGGKWWNVEAADYAASMHRNSEMRPMLRGSLLDIQLGDPDPEAEGGWQKVKVAQLLPDHGHLMHLYAIRSPEMDAVYHLHPSPTGKHDLTETLPAMPAGTYKLFADVVFSNGFPETETADLVIPPGMSTQPLASEDAEAAPPPISAGELGPSYRLPDGYTMVFERPATLTANTAYVLSFTLQAPDGRPATNAVTYLGMAGHAAFVKTDFSKFAHTHPGGSAAMPAVMLAEQSTDAALGTIDGSMAPMSMDGMVMPDMAVPPTVEFPYGFPAPGRYRIFIQMKHAGIDGQRGTVETGVFDVDVR